MRDIPVTGIAHPLADQRREGYVITESRAPVIFLTAGRANLLAAAAATETRVVLVTDGWSALTPAFAETWRTAGAAWVVRSATGGLREGFTGRALTGIGAVFDTPPIRAVDDIDVGHLRATVADTVELLVTVSLRHRARPDTRLGGPLAGLARFVGADQPELWSAYEPAGSRWDRTALTAFVRNRMPADTLVVGTAPGLSGTVVTRRTSTGLEEVTEARLSLGTPSTVRFELTVNEVHAYLADLAATTMPLVGVALVRPGRRDLLIPPVLQHPPSPLALLIGPPGVRSFSIDVEAMVRRFGARPVGRPRIPGLLFSLGTVGPASWERLDAVLSTLDPDQLGRLLGDAARTVEQARPGGVDAG